MVEALSSCSFRAAPSIWGVSNTYGRYMTAVCDQEAEDYYLEHPSPMKQNIWRQLPEGRNQADVFMIAWRHFQEAVDTV